MIDTALSNSCRLPKLLVLESLEKREITVSAYRVWLKLKGVVTDAIGRTAQLSYRDIAKLLDLSMKTVVRAVKLLCGLNFLEKKTTKISDRYFDTNCYVLPDEPVPQAFPQGDLATSKSSISDKNKKLESKPIISVENEFVDRSGSCADQEIKEKIKKWQSIKEKSQDDYAYYQQKISNEPGIYTHFQALGAAEVLRDRAENEITYLQGDLASMESAAKVSVYRESDVTAINTPEYFNGLPGDRKLSGSQLSALRNALKNFSQDNAVAVNSIVYMIRFGTLVKGKFGGINTLERAFAIAMKLVREGRFVPMSEDYLCKKVNKII